MENPINQQLYQAALSLAAGMGIGLVYDGLRAWRRSMGGRTHHAADLFFWFLACGGLYYLGMSVGQGQLRLFMALCAVLGAGAYFFTVSPFVVTGLCAVLGFLARLCRFLTRPIGILWHRAKKFVKTRKNLFPKPRHWVKMKMYRNIDPQHQSTAKEAHADETEKSGDLVQTIDPGDRGIRSVQHRKRPGKHR